jgi:hypothetical protein
VTMSHALISVTNATRGVSGGSSPYLEEQWVVEEVVGVLPASRLGHDVREHEHEGPGCVERGSAEQPTELPDEVFTCRGVKRVEHLVRCAAHVIHP